MMRKVVVPYEHRPADHRAIYLAVTDARRPDERDWMAAYRHIVDGRRVAMAMFPAERRGRVWVRDADGERATRVRV